MESEEFLNVLEQVDKISKKYESNFLEFEQRRKAFLLFIEYLGNKYKEFTFLDLTQEEAIKYNYLYSKYYESIDKLNYLFLEYEQYKKLF